MADVQTVTALRILCGYLSLGISLKASLPPEALQLPYMLLIDAPFGYALTALASLDAHATLIISDNPCPDYWEDLWSMEPQGLLVGGTTLPEITQALAQLARGERFKRTPAQQSPLTQRQRHVLRELARGLDTHQIADILQLKPRTVRNYIDTLKHQLKLHTREQLVLYYWGLWHLLPHYQILSQPYDSLTERLTTMLHGVDR
jgi:DNA-binding CsgD family transcriptional regulator